MSDDALIAVLERQRELALRWGAYHDAFHEGGILPRKPGPDDSEITGPIITALTAHPVFGQGRKIFFAQKQLDLHPRRITKGLLRMIARSDAESAVAWLHRLFKIDRADLRMVAVVLRLELKQPLNLGNGVRLFPLAAAPDSAPLRHYIQGRKNTLWSMLDFATVTPPTIAVFDMGTIIASTGPDRLANGSASNAILDVARAFTLTDQGAPVIGTSWLEFVDPEMRVGEFVHTWMGARFEGSLSLSPQKVDDEAIAWAARYLKMDEQSRRTMGVALDRLNLARRRRSPGDQAIDGGICLEALLGDDSPQELTYKLRLRAALLLGGTVDERQKIREDVRGFYDLRSKVVHGRVRAAKDKSRDAQVASRGLEICTQAVRAIVHLNARPDFATWELTGGPPDNERGKSARK